MPAFPMAAPAKDPFENIKKPEAVSPKKTTPEKVEKVEEEKKEEVKVEEQKKDEPAEPVFAIGDDSDDD